MVFSFITSEKGLWDIAVDQASAAQGKRTRKMKGIIGAGAEVLGVKRCT